MINYNLIIQYKITIRPVAERMSDELKNIEAELKKLGNSIEKLECSGHITTLERSILGAQMTYLGGLMDMWAERHPIKQPQSPLEFTRSVYPVPSYDNRLYYQPQNPLEFTRSVYPVPSYDNRMYYQPQNPLEFTRSVYPAPTYDNRLSYLPRVPSEFTGIEEQNDNRLSYLPQAKTRRRKDITTPKMPKVSKKRVKI